LLLPAVKESSTPHAIRLTSGVREGRLWKNPSFSKELRGSSRSTQHTSILGWDGGLSDQN